MPNAAPPENNTQASASQGQIPPTQTPVVSNEPDGHFVPVPDGKENRFLNIILTLSLLIIVFVIAFIIAYQYQRGRGRQGTQTPTITPTTSVQENTSANCVPLFEIESGPELTVSGTYAQECLQVQNRKDCESVDMYDSANNTFGASDGTPDCKWVGN